MNYSEKMLYDKKLEIDKLEVPCELEERLRKALETKETKKKKNNRWIGKVAALIIATILVGYNMDTFAFYGRKIIGFDEVMSDTLKELNKNGKGQVIDKSYTFKNGITVTLDGVMLDDNQLIAFYTVKNSKGNVDEVDLEDSVIEGQKGSYYKKVGWANINKDKTEEKWNYEFERPKDSDTKLKWKITLYDNKGKTMEVGQILFELDKNKAMGHTFKKNLNNKIKVDKGYIKIKSIKASPTSTYIEGETQSIFKLEIDKIMGEGFRTGDINIKLIADGKELKWEHGEVSTSLKGETFKKKFDALPKNFKKLQIKLVSLETLGKVNEKIKLDKDFKNKSFNISGENVEINEVHKEGKKTYITVTTREGVLLTKVNMNINGESVELNNTSEGEKIKSKDGTIKHKRALCFEGVGENMELNIKGIRYDRDYNKVITLVDN